MYTKLRGMQSYQLLAKDYDALNPKEEIFRQRPFFAKLIRQYGVQSVLDCACGTGWHLVLFQRLGVRTFGSDLSREMLVQARRNLRGRRIPLKRADFRHLAKAWRQQFGMVVCLTTSLPHMLNDRDIVTALKSMYERLSPGGILVVSNGISDALLDAKPAFLAGRIARKRAFYFFLEYPNSNQVVFNILQIKKTASGFAHAYESIQYNAMRKAVLARCFARTKFRRVRYYGDYRFSSHSRRSPRLVVVAEK